MQGQRSQVLHLVRVGGQLHQQLEAIGARGRAFVPHPQHYTTDEGSLTSYAPLSLS